MNRLVRCPGCNGAGHWWVASPNFGGQQRVYCAWCRGAKWVPAVDEKEEPEE